jgi:hypothetical protein
MHQPPDNTQHTHLQRVQQWVERLEARANELLKNINVEELTPKERIDLALKCIAHAQRFLILGQQLEAKTPREKSQQLIMAAIMRQMRGEASTTLNDTLISEAATTPNDTMPEEP